MSTRKEIETAACEIEKKLKDIEVVLKQKEIALKHAHEDMEELHGDWQLHVNNMKFMRHKAEVVDIREFSGVKDLLKTSRTTFEEKSVKYHNLLKTVTAWRKEVDTLKKELGDLKSELSGYPVIILFPEKK